MSPSARMVRNTGGKTSHFNIHVLAATLWGPLLSLACDFDCETSLCGPPVQFAAIDDLGLEPIDPIVSEYQTHNGYPAGCLVNLSSRNITNFQPNALRCWNFSATGSDHPRSENGHNCSISNASVVVGEEPLLTCGNVQLHNFLRSCRCY